MKRLSLVILACLGSTPASAQLLPQLRMLRIANDVRSYVAPQGGFGLLDPRLLGGGNRVITIQPGVVVPPYALPPGNWPQLLRPPMDWDHGPILLEAGPYTPGASIDPNAAIPAGACWAVPSAAPARVPPDNFDGRLVLPGGVAWVPGTFLPPATPVWAWMCANWMWRAIANQPVGR